MAFIPPYMGKIDTEIQKEVVLQPDADSSYLLKRRSEMAAALENMVLASSSTVAKQNEAVWDLNINIKSITTFTRLASLNHPIQVCFNAAKDVANVSLSDALDKKLVPCRDFVLLYRDAGME